MAHIGSLSKLSIREILSAYSKKHISVADVSKSCSDQLSKWKYLNSVITDTSAACLKRATNLDVEGQPPCGKTLWGIPIAVKDNFCTKVCPSLSAG
jgi:aspartyl-tRNA(Asn)/glutamyl-tRNA(Gln) amidotransferase subunit A